MTVSIDNLFKPLQVGRLQLKHRAAMAPLTRYKSSKSRVMPPDASEYYSQRSSRPGTLIIGEATFVSERAAGDPAPGIWNEEQMQAWKQVVDAVHANGSHFYLQLFINGRQAKDEYIEAGHDYVSASAVKAADRKYTPRELTAQEVQQFVDEFVQAAKNAIAIGADGVEIHAANGYMIDQFFHENVNQRTDQYGGSIEKRAKFGLDIVDALIDAIGADRVGVRLSPWSNFGDMRTGVSPIPQFAYILEQLEKRGLEGKRLAYVHMVEPRISGNTTVKGVDGESKKESNRFARDIWTGVLMYCGCLAHDFRQLEGVLEDENAVAAFGRFFISNPDLVDRLEKGIDLNRYDRPTFYYGSGPKGYTDYPFASA